MSIWKSHFFLIVLLKNYGRDSQKKQKKVVVHVLIRYDIYLIHSTLAPKK